MSIAHSFLGALLSSTSLHSRVPARNRLASPACTPNRGWQYCSPFFRGGEKHMFQRLMGKIGFGLVLTCGASSLALAQVPNVDTSKLDSEKAKAGKTKENVEKTTKSSADQSSNAVKKGAADVQDTGRAVEKKTSEGVKEGAAAGKKKAKSVKKSATKATEKTTDAAKDAAGK